MSFETALRSHLEAKPEISRTRDENRVLEILNWPESPRKERVLRRLKRHVEVELGDWEHIDWDGGVCKRGETVGEIDWLRVLQFVCYFIWLLVLIFEPMPVGADHQHPSEIPALYGSWPDEAVLRALEGSFTR